MLRAIDDLWINALLADLPAPPGTAYDTIPFVRFNSSEHFEIRERGDGPYGALQFLSPEPDFARSARTSRISKYLATDKRRVRVDRYPMPVKLNYQVSMYTERREASLTPARIELARRLPESFYKNVDVDIFGDGELTSKAVHFVQAAGVYANPLDQPRHFQIDIPYTVEAWIFFHSAQEQATFWNRAEVSVGVVERAFDIDENTVALDQDDLTLTP